VLSGTLCGGLPMTPLWPSNYGRRMLPGISPLRVPFWREIAESIPMTVATFCPPTTRPAPGCIKHFVIVFVYSDPMEHTPAGLTEKLYWRKARGGGTPFGSFPKYVDMSRCANAGKSHSCMGSKSPGRRLTCGAACAMAWRRSCGDGHGAQARLRHGEPEASVDDEGGAEEPNPTAMPIQQC
jgi:hypothetical protein